MSKRSGKPRGAGLFLRLRRALPRPIKRAREWWIRDRIEDAETELAALERAFANYQTSRHGLLVRICRLRTRLHEVTADVSVYRPQPAPPSSMRAAEGRLFRGIAGAFDPDLPARPWSPDAEQDLGSNVIELSPWSRRA